MKLFRKLRKNLMALGKFKSYTLYALGEIILIVIGISIAWKINDLNDIRKNHIVEYKIYNNLNEELNSNLNVLKGLIDEYPETITAIENTLNYVGKQPNDITAGAKDTIINIADKDVNLLDSSINSLVSTTKFEFIESTELKDLIAVYPNKISIFKEQDAKIKTIISGRLKPVLEKYISLVDMLPNDNSKYAHIKTFGNKSDYSALLASKEYQNTMIDRLLQTKIQLNNAKMLRGKTKILITKLKEELN
ncbi:hypothetical protein ACFFU1_06475 [Algibacter miyuki]|uniref:Gliding motility-associated protein GldM N-terminal domain-containing protein n=1 Tax=Algibacter miyuki TaxID=1306933 RepID=A0ABV5GYB6_9FLAO|nr:hypothetical protein [Algibacter miyuki]MDN3667268.1 hypothetical protein [Algibacter miyuki]